MAFEPSPYEPLDDRTQRRGVVLAGILGLVVAFTTVYMPLAGMALSLAFGGVLLLARRPQWLFLGFVISLAIPIQKTVGGIPLNAADALPNACRSE